MPFPLYNCKQFWTRGLTMPTQTPVKHPQTHSGHHQGWVSHILGWDLSAGPLSSEALTLTMQSIDTCARRWLAVRVVGGAATRHRVSRYGGNRSKASTLSMGPTEIPEAHPQGMGDNEVMQGFVTSPSLNLVLRTQQTEKQQREDLGEQELA